MWNKWFKDSRQLLYVISGILLTGLLVSWLMVWVLPPYLTPLPQLSRQASAARQSGDNKTALRLYRIIAARASDTDFSSNYELGNIYLEKENYQSAEHYYLRAARNDAAPSSVFYQLSDLYLNHLTAKHKSFIAFMESRSKVRPTDESIPVVLANFYLKTNQTDLALVWFKKAATISPGNQVVQDIIKQLEQTK